MPSTLASACVRRRSRVRRQEPSCEPASARVDIPIRGTPYCGLPMLRLAAICAVGILTLAGCGSTTKQPAAQSGPSARPQAIDPIAGAQSPAEAPYGSLSELRLQQIAKKAAPPRAVLADWPAGLVGWTVVLASERDRSPAEALARAAVARGLYGGVLDSSNYSTLTNGYWVAFAGIYDTQQQATASATTAHRLGFANAYPKIVSARPLASTAGGDCGEIKPQGLGPQGLGPPYDRMHVRSIGISCGTARRIIALLMQGKGQVHQGADGAQRFVRLDGWKCFGPHTGTAGCEGAGAAIDAVGTG